jgi:hypothetical protein
MVSIPYERWPGTRKPYHCEAASTRGKHVHTAGAAQAALGHAQQRVGVGRQTVVEVEAFRHPRATGDFEHILPAV